VADSRSQRSCHGRIRRDMGTLTIVTKHITKAKQGGHKEYMSQSMVICINVGDPCISLANDLFCGQNHENVNVSGPNRGRGPALDRSLDVAGVNAHARNVHADEVDSSKPSRCVDDIAQRTHDDLDHGRHVDHHPVDRHPCESEVVGMASGCHHACGGEASPDEGDVLGMVTE
jgi:hypothetical protein